MRTGKRRGMTWEAATLALMAGCVVTLPWARAQGLPAVTLPTLALDPAPTPSIWHGLSVGAEVVAVSSKHGGGFGGDVFAGYDRAFDNNVVVGIRGSTGTSPLAIATRLARRHSLASRS